MPLVTIDGPAITDMDKKRTLVEEVSISASRAFGFPVEEIIVIIKENRPDNVGVGGKLVTDLHHG